MVAAVKTVVLAHGCFDPFHYGHLIHLQEARTHGDVLIVGVTGDAFITKPGRPVFTEGQRAAVLRALAFVDDVKIVHDYGPETLIASIKPHVYCKGHEYKGKLQEQGLVEAYGGRVVFTYHEVASKIKSTSLLRTLPDSFHFAKTSEKS